MGITKIKKRLIRDEIRQRNKKYRSKMNKEMFEKFKYITFTIIPALIQAIFDPTVRNVNLQIERPSRLCLELNNDVIEDLADMCGKKEIYFEKLKYFEDLYRWS